MHFHHAHVLDPNGTASRVGKSDTAWSYRTNSNWAQVIVGVDPDPANNEYILSLDEKFL